jgi:hypothetical protein
MRGASCPRLPRLSCTKLLYKLRHSCARLLLLVHCHRSTAIALRIMLHHTPMTCARDAKALRPGALLFSLRRTRTARTVAGVLAHGERGGRARLYRCPRRHRRCRWCRRQRSVQARWQSPGQSRSSPHSCHVRTHQSAVPAAHDTAHCVPSCTPGRVGGAGRQPDNNSRCETHRA